MNEARFRASVESSSLHQRYRRECCREGLLCTDSEAVFGQLVVKELVDCLLRYSLMAKNHGKSGHVKSLHSLKLTVCPYLPLKID